MSEETRTVSLEQLDEMLNTGVKMAEMQAADYIARGHTQLATHVLTKALLERESRRSELIQNSQRRQAEAAQQAAQQAAAQAQAQAAQTAPVPVAQQQPTTGPLAAPGSPPPGVASFLTPEALALAPPFMRASLVQKAQAATGANPISDMAMPFGLGRRR